MDTDAAAAEFGAVEHEVVGVGAHLQDVFGLVGVVILQMLRLGGRERVVQGVPFVLLVVPLEEREVGEPEGCELVWLAKAQTVAELDAQLAQTGLGFALVAAEDEDKVAGFGFCRFGYLEEVFGAEELVYRALHAAVFIQADRDHSRGANLRTLHPFGEFVGLLTRPCGCSGNSYCANVGH